MNTQVNTPDETNQPSATSQTEPRPVPDPSNPVPAEPEKPTEAEPEPVELPADEPPKSGSFVEMHDRPLTDEELAKGKEAGEAINTQDDTDTGGY